MSSFVLSDSNAQELPIQLISQGTYGCIFKPGMNCKGGLEQEGYITKIQNDKETTRNEYEIGKVLLKDNGAAATEYAERFAPILNSCPVSIGKIKENFIEKCDVIKNNPLQSKFYSNQIRYVGKYTLRDYLSMVFDEPNKLSFIYFCRDFHIYLLNSLVLLQEKNIVHFDLKENNILIDEKHNVPVIIDFGLSISTDVLLQEPIPYGMYDKKFYVYYDKYPPWCLEIVLISFIVNDVTPDSIWEGREEKDSGIYKKKKKDKKNKKKGDNTLFEALSDNKFIWSSKAVKIDDLLAIIDHYFQKNYVTEMISPEHKKKYKTQWNKWIKGIYGEKRSVLSGSVMVSKLMASWKSWDTFGLSVIFFMILQKFVPNHFSEYQDLLIDNILSIPSERENAANYQKRISKYFYSSKSTEEKDAWLHSMFPKSRI